MSHGGPRIKPYHVRRLDRPFRIRHRRHHVSRTADTLVLTALLESDWTQTWTA